MCMQKTDDGNNKTRLASSIKKINTRILFISVSLFGQHFMKKVYYGCWDVLYGYWQLQRRITTC